MTDLDAEIDQICADFDALEFEAELIHAEETAARLELASLVLRRR